MNTIRARNFIFQKYLMQTKTNALLLSTDTLPNYGLDLIFSIAKNTWFDGIDLAMRKWFDAWDDEYVQKL